MFVVMLELEFDVVIFDYMMLVYNGVEFLMEMLYFDKYVGVLVIFVIVDFDLII